MTLIELAAMDTRDAFRWVRRATMDELREVLAEDLTRQLDDYGTNEAIRELHQVYMDGVKGVNNQTRRSLSREIRSMVRELQDEFDAEGLR